MSSEKPSKTRRLPAVVVVLLALLLLAAMGGFCYYIYLLMNDRLGTYTSAAHTADLDNDGNLDAVVIHKRQESESTFFTWTVTWLNQGEGMLTAEAGEGKLSPPFGEQFEAAALGDIDGDGDMDVLAWGAVFLRWQVNQGGAQGGRSGTFKSMGGINSPQQVGQFGIPLVGDLNNDGKLDGVLLGCCGKTFPEVPENEHLSYSFAWLNASDENGWLTPDTISMPGLDGLPIRAAALGDLNEDGSLDLFVAVGKPGEGMGSDPGERVFLNDGTGQLSDSGQRLGDSDSTSVSLGDVDKDGDLDALVGTEYGGLVWLNQGGGSGSFFGSAMLLGDDPLQKVFLSDLNKDGFLEAVLGGENQATIWWNDGQGGFAPSGEHFRYTKRHALAVGDFNSDSAPDLFAPVYSEGYKLWLNDGQGTFELVEP